MVGFHALPHGDARIEALGQKYAVEGLPSLIVLDAAGRLVARNADEDVSQGPQAYDAWLTKAKALVASTPACEAACTSAPTGGECAASAAYGDRHNELVCIGQDLDHSAAETALNACLLTDEEMMSGQERWAALPDPFEAWDDEAAVGPTAGRETHHSHAHHDHAHHDHAEHDHADHGHCEHDCDHGHAEHGHADHDCDHGHADHDCDHGHADHDHCDHSHAHPARKVDARLLAVTPPPSSEISTDKIVVVHQPGDLAKIGDDTVQLAIWRRKSVPNFVFSLSDPSIAPSSLPRFKGLVASTGAAPTLRKVLCSHQVRALTDGETEELVGDVDALVRKFARLTKCKSVFVRLECLEDDGCSSWHQDCVPFRLITTYRGPCTEWVHPDASTATLRRKKANTKEAHSLCHHDVALFKGRGETEHGDSLLHHPGIVHRSPHIQGSGVCRVVLVLDIPRPDHLQ